MADNKIQIILEAYNKTKEAFGQVDKSLGNLNKQIKESSLSQFGANIGALTLRFAAMAAPIAAAVAAIYGLAQKTANAGDAIYKTSQRLGISTEKLSGLKYAAELSNVSMESLAMSIGLLSRNMQETSTGSGDAKDAFTALGISVKDINGQLKPADKIFLELADKFAGMEDGTGKAVIALRIFGRSGAELIPFLNQGASGIENLSRKAKELGIVFTAEASEAAEKFNDNLKELRENINGLIYSVGTELIPIFNKFFLYLKDIKAEKQFGRLDFLDKQIAEIEQDIKTKKEGGLWAWLLPDEKVLKERIERIKKERDALYAELTHEPSGILPSGKKRPAPLIVDRAAEQKRLLAIQEFERRITELTAEELEKRLLEVDKFVVEEKKLLFDAGVKEEEINKRMVDVHAAAAEQKKKITKEYYNENKSAMYQYEIRLIDIAEKEAELSRPAALAAKIELYKQLLAVTKDFKTIQDIKAILTELEIQLANINETFIAGITKGLKQYIKEIKSAFEMAVDFAKQTAQAMERAFSDFFFDLFIGKLKSAEEYIKSFANSILKIISDMIAKLIVEYIALYVVQLLTNTAGSSTGTSGATGGGTSGGGGYKMHKGGLVMHEGGYVPRFHFGGLSSDERPAILQTGEYVVSRKGVAALDKINSGNTSPQVNLAINIENKSSQPVNAKQGDIKFDGKQYVVSVILEDINGYGPLRHAIAGVK